MSKISKDQVKHLAKLAKLNLTDQEIDIYQKELAVIIDFVDQLKDVNVSQLDTTEQVTQLTNVTRVDEILPNISLSQVDLSQNAALEDHQLKVPKVNF